MLQSQLALSEEKTAWLQLFQIYYCTTTSNAEQDIIQITLMEVLSLDPKRLQAYSSLHCVVMTFEFSQTVTATGQENPGF